MYILYINAVNAGANIDLQQSQVAPEPPTIQSERQWHHDIPADLDQTSQLVDSSVTVHRILQWPQVPIGRSTIVGREDAETIPEKEVVGSQEQPWHLQRQAERTAAELSV